MNVEELVLANMEAINESSLCYCLSCQQLLPAQDVEEFIFMRGGGLSGKCPICRKIALVPSASGFQIDSSDKLKEATEAWQLCHALQKEW